MKTPQEIWDSTERPKYGEDVLKWIAAIQAEAFESGRAIGYSEGYKEGASACNMPTAFVVADRIQPNNPTPL